MWMCLSASSLSKMVNTRSTTSKRVCSFRCQSISTSTAWHLSSRSTIRIHRLKGFGRLRLFRLNFSLTFLNIFRSSIGCDFGAATDTRAISLPDSTIMHGSSHCAKHSDGIMALQVSTHITAKQLCRKLYRGNAIDAESWHNASAYQPAYELALRVLSHMAANISLLGKRKIRLL